VLPLLSLTPTDLTEQEDVDRDDIPGNTRVIFAISPCFFFSRGILVRVAKAFFSDRDFGFGLTVVFTDLGVIFLIDLAMLLLGSVGKIERTFELDEEEDEDDADEVGKGMM